MSLPLFLEQGEGLFLTGRNLADAVARFPLAKAEKCGKIKTEKDPRPASLFLLHTHIYRHALFMHSRNPKQPPENEQGKAADG